MARRQTLLELLDDLAPGVAEAFRQSIQRITDDVVLRDLEDAIRRGDIEGAVSLIRADGGYFRPLDEALAAAYGAGGDLTMGALAASARAQGARVRGFFDPRNPRAERYLAEQSSRLITGPAGEIEEIRAAVREVLRDGMQVGTAPETAARNLVGRINRATGQREGGVIGLDRPRREFLASVEEAMKTPEGVRGLFVKDQKTGKFKRRYKQIDGITYRHLEAALKRGKGISSDGRQALRRRVSNSLLMDRGETIARTELLGSVHHAQDEALTQMMEREGLSADAVTQEWDSASDGDTRDSHRDADGQQRQKGQPFDVGGYQMRFPGDRSLGAPAEEIIRCRCRASIDVDWTSLLGPGD